MITVYYRANNPLYPYYIVDSSANLWSGISTSVERATKGLLKHPLYMVKDFRFDYSETIAEVEVLSDLETNFPELFI